MSVVLKSLKAGGIGSVTLKKDGDKYIVAFLSEWLDEYHETVLRNEEIAEQVYTSERVYLDSIVDNYITRFFKKGGDKC